MTNHEAEARADWLRRYREAISALRSVRDREDCDLQNFTPNTNLEDCASDPLLRAKWIENFENRFAIVKDRLSRRINRARDKSRKEIRKYKTYGRKTDTLKAKARSSFRKAKRDIRRREQEFAAAKLTNPRERAAAIEKAYGKRTVDWIDTKLPLLAAHII